MSNDLVLNIEGMHCSSCASKVESALKNLNGVEHVSVDVQGKKAVISTSEEAPSEKELRRAIDKAGFTLIQN